MNRNLKRIIPLISSLLMLLVVVSVAPAATNSNSSSSSNNNRSSSSSSGNSSNYDNAGIVIDANGVLNTLSHVSNPRIQGISNDRLFLQLPKDIARRSDLRLISLNRLEKALIANKGVPSDEMRYLAGITRVKFVFFFEETGDIVLAGPAEGWVEGRDRAYVGAQTGRPVLELQDLVVALRAYPPQGSETDLVGCSIDPTSEGIENMNNYVKEFTRNMHRNGGRMSDEMRASFVNGVRQSLGYHDITVQGVSPNTHLAQVMVAADYRMKLIGLELEDLNVKMVSYVQNADPASVARNSLTRWYFVPDYECVKISEDRTGMELVGNGVKLVEEVEMVSASGERSAAKSTKSSGNRASKQFTSSFTNKYNEIAREAPVYAQLRNVIDLLVCAAHIQREGFYEKSGWSMDFFASEQDFPVELYQAPLKVASVSTGVASKNGRLFSAPVSGGVVIQPERALITDSTKAAEKEKIEKAKEYVKLELAEGQWWWDADLKK